MNVDKLGHQASAVLRRLRREVQPLLRLIGGHSRTNVRTLRSTAWLDGLRGIAALLVFILHHQEYGHHMSAYKIIENPWGLDGEYHFATFPLIRLFFSGGHNAVSIFFIVSGYVLSHKPLQLVHSGELALLAESTGSSLFRRWGRLFLPVYVSTFLWMSSWYMFGVESVSRDGPEVLTSWTAELQRWWSNHNAGDYKGYNVHLWTIPEEFWGSVFIYCTILATCRFTTEARLATELALCAYRLALVKWDALFMVGVTFCDISLLAETQKLPNVFKCLKPRHPVMWYIPFVLGIYISAFGYGFASNPHEFSTYTGWQILQLMYPHFYPDFKFWYRFWGAVVAVTAIPQLPSCKRMLESTFPQYLGRVSYGFYLIHGPLLWTIGVRIYAACGLAGRYSSIERWDNVMKLSDGGPLGLEIRWLVPMLFMLILTLALAEAFTQFVDEPSIKFVHWVFSTGLSRENKSALPVHERNTVSASA